MANEGKICVAIPGRVSPQENELIKLIIKSLEQNTSVDKELEVLIENGERINLKPFMKSVSNLMRVSSKRDIEAAEIFLNLVDLSSKNLTIDATIAEAVLEILSGTITSMVDTIEVLDKCHRLFGAAILGQCQTGKWPIPLSALFNEEE